MPSIEQKTVSGKKFFYLVEQVRTPAGYKKNQVYLGKSIPKNLAEFYQQLANKEVELLHTYVDSLFTGEKLDLVELKKLEEARIKWKYHRLMISKLEEEGLWRRFAIQFIFESNAIEGSRLSEQEVSAIVRKQYVKKNLDRKEIQEVINSIEAFDYLRNANFRLNQRTVINLHALLIQGLEINRGYKKAEIIINNKHTTPSGKVRSDMAALLEWFNDARKTKRHPLLLFADFHQRFELIHPFEDGNGRVGRLLLNWMLIKASYPPILFKKQNRQSYFHALDDADKGRKLKWHRYVATVYKNTVKNLLTKRPA